MKPPERTSTSVYRFFMGWVVGVRTGVTTLELKARIKGPLKGRVLESFPPPAVKAASMPVWSPSSKGSPIQSAATGPVSVIKCEKP